MTTADEFQTWLSTARTGARCEYWRGFLCEDRAPLVSQNESGIHVKTWSARAAEAEAIGSAAMKAAKVERVFLVQERHGRFDYSYIAVAR